MGTKPLVVTTAHKGVFFGYGEQSDAQIVTLQRARMCVYWDNGGVVGLAAAGPGDGCRVTAAAPSITLRDVTAMMECSEAAVTAWEKGPWSR